MEAVSYSDLRQNLKTHLDRVYHNNDSLIVTRKNDENVVVISLSEYNNLTKKQFARDHAIHNPEPEQEDSSAHGFGCLKGKIRIADDFDAPLEDFKDYM